MNCLGVNEHRISWKLLEQKVGKAPYRRTQRLKLLLALSSIENVLNPIERMSFDDRQGDSSSEDDFRDVNVYVYKIEQNM